MMNGLGIGFGRTKQGTIFEPREQPHDITRKNYHVSPDVSSFYVTNFHNSIIPNDLWRTCDCLGKAVDVFIDKKRS